MANYSKMISQLVAGAPGLKGVLIGVVQVAERAGHGHVAGAPESGVRGRHQPGDRQDGHDRPDHLRARQHVADRLPAHRRRSRPARTRRSSPARKTRSPRAGRRHLRARRRRAGPGRRRSSTATTRYIKAKADSIGFAYYDPNTTLARLATHGSDPRERTSRTSRAPTAPFGQFVTLDGVHPSGAAHIQIANDLIAVINAKYGTHARSQPAETARAAEFDATGARQRWARPVLRFCERRRSSSHAQRARATRLVEHDSNISLLRTAN